jgi:organic radical activating enzyme
MNIVQKIKSIFFEKAVPLPVGLYQLTTPADSEIPYRLHLRIEPGGAGVLIINASTVLHLNLTATEFAYHLVKQTPREEALQSIVARFNISYMQAKEDFMGFVNRINTMINEEDLDPVTYLDFQLEKPFQGIPVAPYRMDCAITYKLYGDLENKLSPVERVKRELSTEEWKTVLTKAWNAGIPHVIFTGGEATLRPDLPELLQISEDLGQVTGLITDGLRLSENEYLDRLLNAGLDHLLITLDTANEQSWEALKDVIQQDIHTTVHLTLNERTIEDTNPILIRLKEMQVTHLSLTTSNKTLSEAFQKVRDTAANMGFNLVWNLPVPYSHYNPVEMETENGVSNPEGAAKGWIYLEPDADVLPEQGVNVVLGNLFEDTWEQVWAKATDYLNTKHES